MRAVEISRHSQVDVEYHRGRASNYDGLITADYAVYDSLVLRPWIDRLVHSAQGGSVLDLGCGTGAVTLELARRKLRVEALDHSPDMIEVARKHAHAIGVDNQIRFQVGEITALPYEDSTFDAVTCQRVLHHVPQADRVIAEARRVLKPGGALYLSDSIRDSAPLVALARRAWHRVARRPSPVEDHQFLEWHEIKRSSNELLALVEENGFDYTTAFYSHVGLQDLLSPAMRARVIKSLSVFGRNRSGDMLFVFATRHR